MKKFRRWISILPTCVLMLSVHAAFGQSQPPPMTSAASSPSSVTHATEAEKIVSACAAAAEDLAKQRLLADALDHENTLLRQRLETERATTTLLAELNKTRAGEAAALRSAL